MAEKIYHGVDALQSFIKKPPLESKVFEIDPETAKTILLLYKPAYQRKLKAKLPRFVEAMRDERWGFTGDTIKFGKSGDLLDGQNRLTACVRADVSFTTHVVFGIDDAMFSLLDQGNIRSKEDVFKSAGAPHPNLIAKAVSWAEKIEADTPSDRSAPEAYALLVIYEDKYKGKIEPFIDMAIEASRAFPYPTGQLAALFYHFHEADPEWFTEFFDAWVAHGRSGKAHADKVVSALFERIQQVRADHNRVRDTQFAGWAMEAFATLIHPRRQKVRWEWSSHDEHYPEIRNAA